MKKYTYPNTSKSILMEHILELLLPTFSWSSTRLLFLCLPRFTSMSRRSTDSICLERGGPSTMTLPKEKWSILKMLKILKKWFHSSKISMTNKRKQVKRAKVVREERQKEGKIWGSRWKVSIIISNRKARQRAGRGITEETTKWLSYFINYR